MTPISSRIPSRTPAAAPCRSARTTTRPRRLWAAQSRPRANFPPLRNSVQDPPAALRRPHQEPESMSLSQQKKRRARRASTATPKPGHRILSRPRLRFRPCAGHQVRRPRRPSLPPPLPPLFKTLLTRASSKRRSFRPLMLGSTLRPHPRQAGEHVERRGMAGRLGYGWPKQATSG